MFHIDIEKRTNESPIEYHKRLVYGKLVDKTLYDYDYAEIAEKLYGRSYSSDVARRMMYGSRKTLALIDDNVLENYDASDVSSSIDNKIIEIRKERQKFFDERREYNKVLREKAREEELLEVLERSISNGNIPKFTYEYHQPIASGSDMLVSLNDIHYGSSVENYWRVYNPDVCKSMFESYLYRILSINEVHKCKNCIVWGNGDFISGNIHYSIAVSNVENVIEQTKNVSELISCFLYELSKHFDSVRFVSVSGNHSRVNPEKDTSVTAERLDDLVPWYVKARLSNIENVYVEDDRTDRTMYILDIRGKKYCGVHGDFDGSDGKISSLNMMCGGNLYAVLSGHMHHNKIETVSGVKTVMAGGFLGMDDYCVRKRILGSPEQLVCICDDMGIECYYDIRFEQNGKCESYGT